MKYKVCILAAGSGSRMEYLTTHLNKAILPINFKAVISHIIEKFPVDVEFVIAVGYKKETVIDYVRIAHPERTVTFVEIENFIGPGTGPGYSLLQCREHLNVPFIFYTADTIVLEEVPEPTHNWFGIAPVKNTEPYCTVKLKNNLICQLDDKTVNSNRFAFIGLAGILDHEAFFASLEGNTDAPTGELQVSNGFKKLIEHTLTPIGFTWFDTGTLENYKRTDKNFSGEKKFDFSKGRGEEFLYFVNDKVIKFFADERIVQNRYDRAVQYLAGISPVIAERRGKFYAYRKVDGHVLYERLNNQTVSDFLQWASTYLWKEKSLSPEEQAAFEKACKEFYIEKTEKRLSAFYEKTRIADVPIRINGVMVPALAELMKHIPWESLTRGVPSNFHGDLQFDNVLVTSENDAEGGKFVLLDWRQDFAGLIAHGDLYYDFAKLYGGTLISYPLIKQGMFSFDMSDEEAYYSYYIKNDLVDAREAFEKFLTERGYDFRKVQLITALIFLNMSPLHEEPFDRLLYFMGRSMLYKLLQSTV